MFNQSIHVAIIPDGNRRWAKVRGFPMALGHRKGAKTASRIIRTAFEHGVTHLTFWGASHNNVTKRDPEEVTALFEVFGSAFEELIASTILDEHNVRVRVLGKWRETFPRGLCELFERLEERSKNYTERHLTFLLDYNGTDEMLEAVRALAREKKEGEIAEADLKARLWTKDLPPVDLVVRTGGEPHWSVGFMMWDVAESRLFFTETLWPAFSDEEFLRALDALKEERRNGK